MPKQAAKKRAQGAARESYHHGDLRAALLDAAVELIDEVGLAKLSLRECARRAGVSHAAPYRHFADKNALLLAIAVQGYERLYEAGRGAMEGLTDPRERLDAYGIAYVRFAIENPVQYRAMFSMDLITPDEQQQRVGAMAFDLLVDAASEADSRGTDPHLAALAAWALPHGLAMLILDGRVGEDVVETTDDAEELARALFAVWRQQGQKAP